ncbi:hypothetical protein EC973_008656 [Apophysomyces ossiformis]|uniref:Uncharacterized protein n=1 Tax=Apophysomyces ossiformis TaxID=679940 RepID=A0A8H7ETH1_9FUNG|nr:hypothetical protein EC973_008656 [Apophysomyces ossiformis]
MTDKATSPPPYEEGIPLSMRSDQPSSSIASDEILPYHVARPPNDDAFAPLLQVAVDEDSHTGGSPRPTHTIPYKVQKDSIVSYDQHINEDGEALARFLNEHNTPPIMKIKFRGYHRATQFKSRATHDRDGNLMIEERKPKTALIEDFNFEIDCSRYISTTCKGLYGPMDIRTGHQKTADEVCEEYVQKQARLRELLVTKVVDWNYEDLTKGTIEWQRFLLIDVDLVLALTTAIRSQGYNHNLTITYDMKESKIKIMSGASPFSTLARNPCVYITCFISMLCIIAWPLYRILDSIFNKFAKRTTMTSRWDMILSEREFYEKHIDEILHKTKRKPIPPTTVTCSVQRQ